ncbi:AraC family transcriptional regulator [Lysinibacillus sp. SGAir0095]|uniref:helix-turn-helix domain-containing protein n=1 Tax=Lysinibacillus sp. SGAir0095 TaxID=2070463 RepID=UPI00143DB58D|nr:AraC family transcriptional regulator [Lysinibacillus sp. SGAir0095]
MNLNINQITEYYARAPVMFVDMFMNSMPKGSKDSGRFTAPNLAGLIIPLKGSATFSLNGMPYFMSANTIVHAGPSMNIDIEVQSGDEWQYAVIHYQIAENHLGKYPYFNKHFSISVDTNGLLTELTHQLMKNYITPTNMAKLSCKGLFLQLVETILVSSSKKIDNVDQMDLAVRLIHEQYSRPITIQDLAMQLGIERRRFAYLFERYTGLTPIHYLTEIRIRRAKELLRSGITVAEVAEKVGYLDNFYFSRVFKKHTGLSPTMYKKLL